LFAYGCATAGRCAAGITNTKCGVRNADGRLTVTELAGQVGLSISPCHRRLRALERSGAIRGYRAVVDAEAVGLGVRGAGIHHHAPGGPGDADEL
jgi:DNA-binding Lrp family transcriptional regulator